MSRDISRNNKAQVSSALLTLTVKDLCFTASKATTESSLADRG